jgi:hypothetical protein
MEAVIGDIRTLVRRPPPLGVWACQTTWLKKTWAKVVEKMTRRKKWEKIFIWESAVDVEDDTVLLLWVRRQVVDIWKTEGCKC